MKRFLALILIPLLAASVAAAGGNLWLVVAANKTRPVAVALPRVADFISVPITLYSEEKEPELRFAEINNAIAWLEGIVKDNPRIKIYTGPAALSANSRSKLFSYSDEGETKVRTWILATLPEDKDNIFTGAVEISKFLKTLKFPGKVTFVPGSAQLAVDNPDKYRDALLALIAGDVALVRTKLGTQGAAVVHGLESPVMVRQLDDRQVELYLDYTIDVNVSEKQNMGE